MSEPRPPLNLEVDGKPVQVPAGSTVMDATRELGVYVPHFCYHRKLSIAANCRMCLVQVEKAPKPLPACATPATEGMKVWTHSDAATDAQKGVMEFLLINHPLDCPICDQGGECQLQDLAMGYGASSSRYDEPKRVVFNKYLGPLIATDMTRCIHCTRCVRFGQEIAGVMELGMANRGENSEIMTFVGKTVNSELSGNMIDLCPVGALTSKPFRYSARTWELVRRKTVSPHDGLGSNLIAHVKNDRVMRVLPSENEAINECWISDRDRFSYDALNSEDRLLHPIIKRNGRWEEADWQIALEYVVKELARVRDNAGGAAIGAIGSPHATVEELYLLQKLARGLQSDNVDFRLRQSDFSNEGKSTAVPWLGMSIADFARLDRYFIIGSYLRKDQPLLSHRVRQATKRGAELSLLHAVDDDLLMRVTGKTIVPPSAMVAALSAIVAAAADGSSVARDDSLRDVAVDDAARAIAASLAGGKAKGIFLGSLAQHHPDASRLHALAQRLAELTGATLGFLTEAANSLGGHIAGARPRSRSSTPPTRLRHRLRWPRFPLSYRFRRSATRRTTTRTCCCRSRRSPKQQALSSTAKVARKASTALRSPPARADPRGRCCVCWVPCSGSPGSITPASNPFAARRSARATSRTACRMRHRLRRCPRRPMPAPPMDTTARWNASPKCPSTSPIHWSAVRVRCRRPSTPGHPPRA
jgi:NADH-quinone oxidoreductase subunit G